MPSSPIPPTPPTPPLTHLPTPHDLKEKASTGHQFTREEVRNLTESEMATTGKPGPMPKGPAATIQSIYDAQQRFANEAERLVEKGEQITKEEATGIMGLEIRGLGGHNPPHGSLGSQAMHMVDTRED